MSHAASGQGHCSNLPRRLVLASSSPRRIDLLQRLGLDFEVDPSSAPEEIAPGLQIAEVVVAIATGKARDVAPRHPDDLVIAADTLVALENSIFGKPRDADEAREMLHRMSGRTHRVYTGLVALDPATMEIESRVVETEVRFRQITDAEIDAYVRTDEPLDKAGAYGIQGLGAVFVDNVAGDYWNVVGLPLAALNDLLNASGYCLICRNLHAASASLRP